VALTPAEAIDAVNDVFGRHPGRRALHAKGTLCRGSFTAAPEAAQLTVAGHMQGAAVPVTVRFSNGGGDPGHPDWAPDPRGLAIKFYLPDGSRTDIVAVSSPRLPTRTPEAFIELIQVQGAGLASAWKLPRFFSRHPEALRALPRLAPTLAAPASYAAIPYYAIHAFKWIDSDGTGRFLRYELRPEVTQRKPAPWRARRLGRDYLQQELVARLARQPIGFRLALVLAGDGDRTDDPSVEWPQTRPRAAAGRLEITALELEREQGDDVLVFDPTRVTAGIELSDDPVLGFRRAAYSESVARRT
jgi:catalase